MRIANGIARLWRQTRSRSFIARTGLTKGVDWGGDNFCGRGVEVHVAGRATVEIGRGSELLPYSSLFSKNGILTLGEDCTIGIGAIIASHERIAIGNSVLIGEYVSIRDQDHEYVTDGRIRRSGFRTGPIEIGDNVWIGAKATITRSVTIGEHAVIAANSVVTQSVPPHTLVAGVPAIPKKKLAPLADVSSETTT